MDLSTEVHDDDNYDNDDNADNDDINEHYGQDLREATHDDAVRVLKNTGGQVAFVKIAMTMMTMMFMVFMMVKQVSFVKIVMS